jgi:hypothetical protein
MFRDLFSHRSHITALIVLLAVSLVSTQVPLFNYLGYEFSAFIAVVWSLLAGLLTISLWKKTAAEPNRSFSGFVRRSLVLCLAPLLIPVIVMIVNAFFVKNCSFIQGAIFYVLIVGPAVLFTNALSLFVAVWIAKWKKTMFAFLWAMVLLHIVYVTFTRPQIFAFNPIIGYFAGLTYDEALDVMGRLALYRIGTVAFSALFLLGAFALDRRRRHETVGDTSPHSALVRRSFVLALTALVVLMYFFSNRLGLSSSDSFIRDTLGGSVETDHFVISYPDTLIEGERLAQIIRLHEFYYEQLARTLRVRPSRKIHTFLYVSAEQKGQLIGAAGTNIAKPWLWQLHINLGDIDASLKHELVHVLAADFGFPLIRIGVNSGLIEGLATAVDRVEYEEPVHRLAALVFHADLAPDVEGLFSITGFMKAPAGVSYILAGSFCRYLIDRYGMRRFKMLYRTGEFTALYGKPLPTLLDEWKRFLGTFRFNGGDRAKAEYLFKRRSIFGKVCARVIANQNMETRQLLSDRQYDEALRSAEKSLAHTLSVEAAFHKTTALVRLGRYQEAVSYAQGLIADSAVAPSFLTLRILLGDALWALDSLESAVKVHADLLRSHLSLAWDESLSLRLEILLRPDLSKELRYYFVAEVDDSVRIAQLRKIIAQRTDNILPKLLLAREKTAKKEYEEATRLLEGMPPLKSPILELARQRRLGQLAYTLGQYERAKIHFWQSLNYVYRDAQALEIEERLRFCEWMTASNATVN